MRKSWPKPTDLTEWTNSVDTVRRSVVLVVNRSEGRRSNARLDPLDHGGEDVVLGVVVQWRHIIGRLLHGTERVRTITSLHIVSYRHPNQIHYECIHN